MLKWVSEQAEAMTARLSLRPQRSLRVAPGAGAAVARVAYDFDANVRMCGLDGPRALATVSMRSANPH